MKTLSKLLTAIVAVFIFSNAKAQLAPPQTGLPETYNLYYGAFANYNIWQQLHTQSNNPQDVLTPPLTYPQTQSSTYFTYYNALALYHQWLARDSSHVNFTSVNTWFHAKTDTVTLFRFVPTAFHIYNVNGTLNIRSLADSNMLQLNVSFFDADSVPHTTTLFLNDTAQANNTVKTAGHVGYFPGVSQQITARKGTPVTMKVVIPVRHVTGTQTYNVSGNLTQVY